MLADFPGFLKWAGGGQGTIEVEGTGVGMVRHMNIPGTGEMAERLDRLDHGATTIGYSLVYGNPAGMAESKGTNIVLDIVFVVFLGWGVPGIAAATLIAEVIALLAGLAVVSRHLASTQASLRIRQEKLLDVEAVSRMLMVNRDIMIRSFALLFAFAFFTAQGAKFGELTLAAMT